MSGTLIYQLCIIMLVDGLNTTDFSCQKMADFSESNYVIVDIML